MQSIREDKLARALRWSLFGHGAVALFVVLKSLVFPGDPVRIAPSLRVDMVGLPDLLKKDLSQVSKTLPKTTAPEKPAEVAKEAEKAKPVKPPEVPKSDELVLNPKKAEKAAKEEENLEDKKREKKLQSALARIRSLERLKDKNEEADDDSVVIKGNQVSQGASLSGDAKENAQAGYYDLVRESLVEVWALPPWLGRQKLSAQVLLKVDPTGRVLSTKFVKNSGNAQFDEAILATIRGAQPLPRPPKELQEILSNNGVIVGFPL